ncbi:hypothetical protein [Actinomadura macrotermitis]|uniref:hypothetical protein n=1 Tax=Actinomadura macrotermitis TaxID=2585200 RepID=UPI001294A8E5|nr:hypothetical protein [Actinomadura macrotermitis]
MSEGGLESARRLLEAVRDLPATPARTADVLGVLGLCARELAAGSGAAARDLAWRAGAWLSDRLRSAGPEQAEYFRLVGELVPLLGADGNSLLTQLALTRTTDAVPCLTAIARDPRTPEPTRRLALEHAEEIAWTAHPSAGHLPIEVWRCLGKRLARLQRDAVTDDDGSLLDQAVVLTFEDGTVIQLWAGHYRSFVEGTPLEDDWLVHDDDTAVGQVLAGAEAADNGLTLRFERATLSLTVVEDVHFKATWS